MKVTPEGITGACDECAFFKDCPMNYFCPPAEIVKFLIEEQKAGRVKLLFREDLLKELEDEE